MYFIQHCFMCRPSDSTVSEYAGIEPRTVAALEIAVREMEGWIREKFGLLDGRFRKMDG
jgi:hypothetical protein